MLAWHSLPSLTNWTRRICAEGAQHILAGSYEKCFYEAYEVRFGQGEREAGERCRVVKHCSIPADTGGPTRVAETSVDGTPARKGHEVSGTQSSAYNSSNVRFALHKPSNTVLFGHRPAFFWVQAIHQRGTFRRVATFGSYFIGPCFFHTWDTNLLQHLSYSNYELWEEPSATGLALEDGRMGRGKTEHGLNKRNERDR